MARKTKNKQKQKQKQSQRVVVNIDNSKKTVRRRDTERQPQQPRVGTTIINNIPQPQPIYQQQQPQVQPNIAIPQPNITIFNKPNPPIPQPVQPQINQNYYDEQFDRMNTNINNLNNRFNQHAGNIMGRLNQLNPTQNFVYVQPQQPEPANASYNLFGEDDDLTVQTAQTVESNYTAPSVVNIRVPNTMSATSAFSRPQLDYQPSIRPPSLMGEDTQNEQKQEPDEQKQEPVEQNQEPEEPKYKGRGANKKNEKEKNMKENPEIYEKKEDAQKLTRLRRELDEVINDDSKVGQVKNIRKQIVELNAKIKGENFSYETLKSEYDDLLKVLEEKANNNEKITKEERTKINRYLSVSVIKNLAGTDDKMPNAETALEKMKNVKVRSLFGDRTQNNPSSKFGATIATLNQDEADTSSLKNPAIPVMNKPQPTPKVGNSKVRPI